MNINQVYMNTRILLTAIFVFSIFFAVSQKLPRVNCSTGLGDFVLEVDTIHAPITGKNFLFHIKNGTYKNAVFYRVVRMNNQPQNDIKIEVIQGGLFADSQIEKIPVIPHENTEQTGIKHLDGTLSMARMEPGTASTEFFICVGNQPELDFGGKRNPDGQGFAAFGKVVKGMDVVRRIQQQKDKNQILIEPVKIVSLKIIP